MASEMLDAFGQGVAVANAIEDRFQQRKALGSAIDKYGDKARDPGLFAALQETDIAASREARTERESQQNMQIRGAQESRASETFTRAKSDDDVAKRQKATLGLVQGLRQARDRGEDVGAAFDKLAETLPSLGVNPDDIPEMRQAVVDNPKILDDYLAALTGGAKEPGKEPGKATSATGGEAGALERASQDIFNRLDILEGKDAEFVEGVGGEDEFTRVQESIFGTPTLRGARAGGYGSFGSVTGTRAADYAANYEALSGDIRSAAFETLKGGGQITEKESEFAADAIAKLTRSTSPAEYRRELKRLRAYMENLMGVAARRANGEEVPEQLGYPAEAAVDDSRELAKRILDDPNADPADRQWAETQMGTQ